MSPRSNSMQVANKEKEIQRKHQSPYPPHSIFLLFYLCNICFGLDTKQKYGSNKIIKETRLHHPSTAVPGEVKWCGDKWLYIKWKFGCILKVFVLLSSILEIDVNCFVLLELVFLQHNYFTCVHWLIPYWNTTLNVSHFLCVSTLDNVFLTSLLVFFLLSIC